MILDYIIAACADSLGMLIVRNTSSLVWCGRIYNYTYVRRGARTHGGFRSRGYVGMRVYTARARPVIARQL